MSWNILDLKYQTKKHDTLCRRVMDRFRMSERKRKNSYDRWAKAEEDFIAYMPAEDAEKIREGNVRHRGEVDYYKIVVPYHYAITMTSHTYWTSVFLARDPVFQFQGRHGESQTQVQAIEAIQNYQMTVGKSLPVLVHWILDASKYGEGIIGEYWCEEERRISSIEEVPVEVEGEIVEGRTKKERVTKRVSGFKGNKLYNVKPQAFFPDPRVPLANFQSGEFCGRTCRVGWNTILRGKAQGSYMNVEALRKVKSSASAQRRDYGSAQIPYPEQEGDQHLSPTDDVGYVDLIEMYVELVPKEWDLGSSEFPEKWLFTIAEEKVIIGARPMGYLHDEFPFTVKTLEIDAYRNDHRGQFDITRSLNDVLTWLFNSHMFNVRQVLNNQFIFDPSRVVQKDLTTGKPGIMARLAPAAYGTNPRDAIHQLQVQDVTSRHLEAANAVTDMMQRLTGVTDNVMGQVNPGGRKTATEIRTSSSFSVNRLKMQAEYWSMSAWAPLSQRLVQNTQQFYDGEETFRIVGNLREGQQANMQITPDDIAGFYDFEAVDGTMPVDRFAQAQAWQQIIESLMGVGGEQVLQEFDFGAIFAYVAQLMGVKNLDQFRREGGGAMPSGMEAMGEQELQQQVQSGDMVSIQEALANAANNGGTPEPSRSRGGYGGPGGIDEAPELPGMGPVG